MLLYDSFSRERVELPGPPGAIRMYLCGPTVYQRIHVGNARPLVIALWLRSGLRARGYDVTLVENVTDVNDKIYEAAAREGIPSAELAEKATRWHLEDTDAMGLGRPDARPLASETMAEIVALIGELLDRGLAYESGGDVYFRVAAFPEYGRLSGADPDEMVAQEPSDLKEDPRDFALWKANKPQEDTWWESPWGRGRPGWHIECSAMALRLLPSEMMGKGRLAHIHLTILGFVTLAIVGTAHNLFPAVMSVPLYSLRLARWTFFFLPAGILMLIAGFVSGQLLLDLGRVAMCKHAIGGHVAVALREMGPLGRCLAGARDSALGVDENVPLQETGVGERFFGRQANGKTAGVGDLHRKLCSRNRCVALGHDDHVRSRNDTGHFLRREARQAHELIEDRAQFGKIVLKPQ